METFCREMVSEIKTAPNERDLIRIIGNSMHRLRIEKNSFNESGYIINMIAALRTATPMDTTSQTFDNIRPAIEIFRQFQRSNPGRIC